MRPPVRDFLTGTQFESVALRQLVSERDSRVEVGGVGSLTRTLRSERHHEHDVRIGAHCVFKRSDQPRSDIARMHT